VGGLLIEDGFLILEKTHTGVGSNGRASNSFSGAQRFYGMTMLQRERHRYFIAANRDDPNNQTSRGERRPKLPINQSHCGSPTADLHGLLSSVSGQRGREDGIESGSANNGRGFCLNPAELLCLPRELMSQRLETLAALVLAEVKPVDWPPSVSDSDDGLQRPIYSGVVLVLWLLKRRLVETFAGALFLGNLLAYQRCLKPTNLGFKGRKARQHVLEAQFEDTNSENWRRGGESGASASTSIETVQMNRMLLDFDPDMPFGCGGSDGDLAQLGLVAGALREKDEEGVEALGRDRRDADLPPLMALRAYPHCPGDAGGSDETVADISRGSHLATVYFTIPADPSGRPPAVLPSERALDEIKNAGGSVKQLYPTAVASTAPSFLLQIYPAAEDKSNGDLRALEQLVALEEASLKQDHTQLEADVASLAALESTALEANKTLRQEAMKAVAEVGPGRWGTRIFSSAKA
jgi:hypothetical protein